jgi:hypothetical protein
VWLTFAEGKTIFFRQCSAESGNGGVRPAPLRCTSTAQGTELRIRKKIFEKIILIVFAKTDRRTPQDSVATNQGFTLSPRRIEYM